MSPTIAELMRHRMDVEGYSQYDVARRAKMSQQTIQSYLAGKKSSLRPANIKAMAEAIGVAPWRVVHANLTTVGLPVGPQPERSVLAAISDDPDLTDEQRRYLTVLYEAMVEEKGLQRIRQEATARQQVGRKKATA